MSAITCPAGSANCGTINNCLLPTTVPANVYTGLTAVNVNDAQDWRVYYLDKNGAVSQLEGNASGFATGEQIGGSGLNASSLAAVNVNSTTNNINLFYVDDLTRNLFKMQFTNGAWTTRESFFYSPLHFNTNIHYHSISSIHCFYSLMEPIFGSWRCIQLHARSAACLLHRS